MTTHTPVEALEQQDWLEPVEEGLQKAVGAVYESAGPAGRQVKNFLHGVWLGHPLHPALTDVPLGAWTATLVLDLMEEAGHKGLSRSTDITLKVGLAGAVASAAAGLTDWQATDGAARRVGVTHGLLNLTATGLYAISLIERNRRNRGSGRLLAYCGFAVAGIAAWLGGNLVYGKQIGVNHAAGEHLPEDWTDAGSEADLAEDRPVRAMAGKTKVLLVKRAGEIHAIAEVCSHLGGPLSEGKLDGDVIECPWHASRFCVRDGSVVDGPATHPQPRCDVRVRGGRIEVRSWPQE